MPTWRDVGPNDGIGRIAVRDGFGEVDPDCGSGRQPRHASSVKQEERTEAAQVEPDRLLGCFALAQLQGFLPLRRLGQLEQQELED